MRGELWLELADGRGAVVARRHARNAVMQAGGQLVADLFSGKGAPITHMGVGISNADNGAFDITALDTGSGGPDALTGETEAAIPAEAFTVDHDPVKRVFVVRVRATIASADGVGEVAEAGLLAKTDTESVLYNRVTFSPITKTDDHELTLFWEVSFPYGDLQTLF